jgi:hypothetical protein
MFLYKNERLFKGKSLWIGHESLSLASVWDEFPHAGGFAAIQR